MKQDEFNNMMNKFEKQKKNKEDLEAFEEWKKKNVGTNLSDLPKFEIPTPPMANTQTQEKKAPRGFASLKQVAVEILKIRKMNNIVYLASMIGVFLISIISIFSKMAGNVLIIGIVVFHAWQFQVNKKEMLYIQQQYKI